MVQDAERSDESIPSRDETAPAADGPGAAASEPGGGPPVVGIGASAGGLDALNRLFGAMPVDTGIAFVVVPHLDPSRDSLMVDLLARKTKMPVQEARDAMPLEADHVYVIPPNKYLSVVDRTLRLAPTPDRYGAPTAIDYFFRSLAADQRERAIVVVLSGTSSHGSQGLKDVKLAGGMALAQEPESAEYDQMPRNAIATGLVDFVLSPERMPEVLISYVRHPYVRTAGSPGEGVGTGVWEQLHQILTLLKSRTSYDFHCYRKNMLMRRVLRRMSLAHFEQMTSYLDYLRESSEEVAALTKDLLISVTDFFRDAEAFRVLEDLVIPELVHRTSEARQASPPATTKYALSHDATLGSSHRPSIRVWVPACATGEEAYSIAMLLLERLTAESAPTDSLRIFATDIDDRALETARQGLYSDSEAGDVSPERLLRFFTRQDPQHWRVAKTLRETVTFARQNLIGDAPFSKLDLICCRNLLIYLEPDVQAKVIRLFHFALSDGGYLMLGPSESLGKEANLFEPVSKKWRIFRRIGAPRRPFLEIPLEPHEKHRPVRLASFDSPPEPTIGYKQLLQRLVLERFAPAAALINRRHEIVSVIGPLVDYLEFPPGEISRDLLAMARPGLRTKIRAAVLEALRLDAKVSDRTARVKRGDAYVPCTLTVTPIAEPADAAGLLVVAFHDREPSSGRRAVDERKADAAGAGDSSLLDHLERELKSARGDLQSSVEEFESSTEELKASNEEIMSMNEELQSANEELETSREELQSLNEELCTANNQLQEKVEELDRSNTDLTNLMASSDVATLFLDARLHIQRFTPALAALLNLRSSDLDRPFADFASKFVDDTLLQDCHEVLTKLAPNEKEVWTKREVLRMSGGAEGPTAPHDANVPVAAAAPPTRCYFRRILPYRTLEQRVVGVVVTFIDVTARVAAEAQSRRLAGVLWDSNDAVTLLNFDGRIVAWNRGAERVYGYSEAESLHRNVTLLVPEELRVETLAALERLSRGESLKPFESRRVHKDGRILDVDLTYTVYRDETGRPIGVATTERDITERKRADAQLRATEDRTRAILETAADAIITIDARGIISAVNGATERMFGYSADELIGHNVRILMPLPYREEHDAYLSRFASTGEPHVIGQGREALGRRKNGSTFPVDLAVSQVDHLGFFVGIIRDASERKELEKQVLEIADEEQRRIGQELHDGTGQELTGLTLLAGSLAELLKTAPHPHSGGTTAWSVQEPQLQRLRQTADRLTEGLALAGRHVQALSHGIMPVRIDAEGLRSALEELASSITSLRKITCRFECPTVVSVTSTATATHLYRIAQEALNNAMRHSQASQVTILLSQVDEALVLEIRDNGIGFDVDARRRVGGPARNRGFGLEIMNYRAGMIGGACRVASQIGKGTVVRCAVPLRGETPS